MKLWSYLPEEVSRLTTINRHINNYELIYKIVLVLMSDKIKDIIFNITILTVVKEMTYKVQNVSHGSKTNSVVNSFLFR